MIPRLASKGGKFSYAFGIAFFGALIIVAGLVSYPVVLSRFPISSVESSRVLELLAYLTLLLTLVGLFGVGYGLRQILRVEVSRLKVLGQLPASTFSIVANILAEKAYSRISDFSTLAYGFFYAFISGIIVYRPWEKFSEVYLAKIPSILVIPQDPSFVVYLTEQLGMLITPINLILLFAVSWLVGLNMSIALFAYRNRPHGVGGKWYGGFGAVVGLFTGCPTCAGLLSSAIVGGVGSVSIVTALVLLQTIFIAISIPILLVTPLLTTKNLIRTFSIGRAPSRYHVINS